MSDQNQFLLYTAPDGAVKVDVFFKDETVWLTQKALAELFGVQRPAITKHLGNIFSTRELVEDSACSILEHTAGQAWSGVLLQSVGRGRKGENGRTYDNFPLVTVTMDPAQLILESSQSPMCFG